MVLLGCAAVSLGQWTPAERHGIDSALFVGGMTASDLAFARKPFPNVPAPSLVSLALSQPLEAADALLRLHAGTKGASTPVLVRTAITGGLGDPPVPDAIVAAEFDLDPLPTALRPPISELLSWVQKAKFDVDGATEGLSEAEKKWLASSLPVYAAEEARVRFDFPVEAAPDAADIARLLAKVDLVRIRRSASGLAAAVERAAAALKASTTDVTGRVEIEFGEGQRLIVAGRGEDVHSRDADVLIDLGGDDLYTAHPGGARLGVAVSIDCGGDDRYFTRDLAVGAGLLGIGITRDLGGADLYRTTNLSLGAGLAGVGVFSKDDGDDVYFSNAVSQGFGQYGLGLCSDSGGSDRYELRFLGQGAGRTEGLGWLVDQAGADTYRAGGLVPNSPLFETATYSFAQGFGQGYREDTGGVAGGVGLLTDHEGDDAYLGDTYVQAAAYWMAVGSLYDAAGADTYSATHYAQASAMHLCGAYLFDLAGDDGYFTRYGAAHAIGHDYGVAVLLDRAGNDVYAARDTNPGLGVANGVGIFVDAAGIDSYPGLVGRGNPARDSGSLGVFADLEGKDRYPSEFGDGQATSWSTWGVAWDAKTPDAPTTGGTSAPKAGPTPGSLAAPSAAELEKIYEKATQWGVGTAQTEVAANLDKLVAIGTPAFDWMLSKKFASANRLEMRAFNHMVGALGAPARAALANYAQQAPVEAERNLLAVAMESKVEELGPWVASKLAKPELRSSAIRASGALKAVAAVPQLLEFARSDDVPVVRASLIALRQIGDVRGLEAGQALLSSSDLPNRMAALDLVASFLAQAEVIGESLTREADPYRARTGVRLLGRVGTEASLSTVGQLLMDPRPGVRIEALLQLAGRIPAEYRESAASLAEDPVEEVRAVATWVLRQPERAKTD